MLYIGTCVLLAVLLPEAHSATATAFLEKASAPLAISSWSVTELHSALGLKVRTKALSQAQADAAGEAAEMAEQSAPLRSWRLGRAEEGRDDERSGQDGGCVCFR